MIVCYNIIITSKGSHNSLKIVDTSHECQDYFIKTSTSQGCHDYIIIVSGRLHHPWDVLVIIK